MNIKVYEAVEKAEKEGYLFDKDILESLTLDRTKIAYCQLSLISFNIKYAVRTLNLFLAIEDKDLLKEAYAADLDSGSWTIDICDYDNIDFYFNEHSLQDIRFELINFCLDWAENELDSSDS